MKLACWGVANALMWELVFLMQALDPHSTRKMILASGAAFLLNTATAVLRMLAMTSARQIKNLA